MSKKETLGFNPRDLFEDNTTGTQTQEKTFNPRTLFVETPSEQTSTFNPTKEQFGVPDLDKVRNILKNVKASEAEKEYVIDMAAKGASHDEISDAILTIQGQHPKQTQELSTGQKTFEGLADYGLITVAPATYVAKELANLKQPASYYLEETKKGYKIPKPLAYGEKSPKGTEINSIWGTPEEADENGRIKHTAKMLYNIIPHVKESGNELSQLVYGMATGDELPWYQAIKNENKKLEAKTGTQYQEGIGLDLSKVKDYNDIFNIDNWDFSPSKIANTFTNLGQFYAEFLLTRGALGTAGKGATAAVKAGEITKAAAEKAIKIEEGVKAATASYLTNLPDMMNQLNEAGIHDRTGYALGAVATGAISLIDAFTGGGGAINKAFEKQTGKSLIGNLIKGSAKDFEEATTKEAKDKVLEDLYKTAFTAAETVAQNSEKGLVRNVAEEAIGEPTQDIILKASQALHDKMVSDEETKYGTELFSPRSVAEEVNAGIQAAIGGAQGHILSKPLKQKEQDDEKSKTIMGYVSSGNVNELKTQLAAARKSGDISQEDYDKGIFRIDRYQEYYDATKDRPLDEESKRKIFDLTYEKANVNAGIEHLEKSNVDGINDGEIAVKKDHIKEIEKRVDDIWKGAEEKEKEIKETKKPKFKFTPSPIEYPERKVYGEGEDVSAEEFNDMHVEDKFHYMYDKAIEWQKKGVKALHGTLEIPNNRAAFVSVGNHTVELASSDQDKKVEGEYVNGVLRDFDNQSVRIRPEEINGFKALVLYDAEGHPIMNAEGKPYTVRQTEAGVGISKYGHEQLLHPSNLEYKSEGVHPDGNFATWKTGLEGEIETPEVKEQIANATRNPHKENTYGEKYIDFATRAINAYKRLLAKAKDKTLLVTHSQVMKLIDQWEKQGRPEDLNELDFNEIAKEKYGEEEVRQYPSVKGNIIIVRHGDTPQNESVKETPNKVRTTDVPLAEEGIQTAIKLGEKLRPLGISDVVTSPLKRARETAIIIKKIIHGQGGKETKPETTPIKPKGGLGNETKTTEKIREEGTEKEAGADKEVVKAFDEANEKKGLERREAFKELKDNFPTKSEKIKVINDNFENIVAQLKNTKNLIEEC